MKFTIITCTYNPNSITFSRLINSIQRIIKDFSSEYEWLIVDNNCTIPIEEEFTELLKFKFVKVIKESRTGLTYARIAGIKAAIGNWIIFFDDDNEPDSKYLSNLAELSETYSDIVCWGAGDISVKYLRKSSKLLVKFKSVFQERHLDKELLFSEVKWQKDYPVGTGLCVKKDAIKSYLNGIEKGKYTATDRTGRSLISGGDTQMCLDILNKNLMIGSSPKLKLNHLIEERKANFKYILKQRYWTASSYVFVHNQVMEKKISIELISGKNILIKAVKQFYYYLKVKRMGVPESLVHLATFLGNINARYIAANKKTPNVLSIFEKLIA